MYYLYHAKANPFIVSMDYTIREVVVNKASRKYLDRMDWIWYIITFGRSKKIIVLDCEGQVVHTSRVIGKCFKFPFLSKFSAEIGPCATKPNHRGQGIYPNVLRYILSDGGWKEYYMLVREDNLSSIKGIEKAGFVRVGTVRKERGRWVRENLFDA